MKLRRFWFEFERTPGERLPPGTLLGCGVTAFTLDDAIYLLRRRVFTTSVLPRITRLIEDVDVSTLDAGHVLPNMGVVVWRGVWYPLGYHEPGP